jgi:6-phosphogluconolactonase
MSSPSADALTVFIGTYTPAEQPTDEVNGIYSYRLDMESGALHFLSAVSGVVNPSYLAIDRQRRYLYAVEETEENAGQPGGAVSAFKIDRQTSALAWINRQPSHGAHPCYVSIDGSGRWLLAANYSGGNLCALPIEKNGALGPARTVIQHSGSSVDAARQEGPHAHSIIPDPNNRFALAADLGLDQILSYRLDADRGLIESHTTSLRPGAGPRHLVFHPSGALLYCMNELDSTITAFAYDAESGALRELQTVGTLPDDFAGSNSGADIHIHPSGQFLYSSNRGHDSIAIFRLDQANGQLQRTGHVATGGRTPRNFAIDPTGTFLLAANQGSDTVVTFRIDRATGNLTPAGQETSVHKPVCVRVVARLGE